MHFVTGATGHIGNVLVRQLLSRGERVRALVRPTHPPIALEGLDVELVTGDILDPDSLVRPSAKSEPPNHAGRQASPVISVFPP